MNLETYTFNIGPIQCIAATDGHFNYPLPTFFANVDRYDLQPILRQDNLPTTHITTPYTCLLIISQGQRILVDTGAGRKAEISAALFPTVDNGASVTGRLLPNLQAAGIQPGDIDKVIITHAHPDHIGGMLDAHGQPNYPNAQYFIAEEEWRFWMSDDAADKVSPALIHIARTNLQPIASRITTMSDGQEIAPGVHAVQANGHTPGHTAIAVSAPGGAGDRLLHISDLALHPLHLQNPHWYPVLDIDPARAAVTRARILNQAAAQNTLLFAHHFAPFPALGTVEKAVKGWRWKAAEQ